tara:strand:+ start:2223 stop:2435 length:213 start_codon:yes stop_codon:yes gene_type:complete
MAKSRLSWKQQKTLTVLKFRRINNAAFTPVFTLGTEFLTEQSTVYSQNYIVTETIFDPNNNNLNYYIIAE